MSEYEQTTSLVNNTHRKPDCSSESHYRRDSDVFDAERHPSTVDDPTSQAYEEIEEDHRDIIQKRMLLKKSEEEILHHYRAKSKIEAIKVVTESEAYMRISSKHQLGSTSNTDTKLKHDEEEPYSNPNLRNDLS